MMFANAVNRPYRQNLEVVRNLHSDGAKFLSVRTPPHSALGRPPTQSIDPRFGTQTLLFVRLVNLVLAILSTVSAPDFTPHPRLLVENLIDLSAWGDVSDRFVGALSKPTTRFRHD